MTSDEAFDLDAVPLARRFVLLGLVALDREGETPATSHAVKRSCGEHRDVLADGVVGTVTEPEVMRALYALEDERLVVEERRTEPSAVGKGRPEYGLAVEADAVLDALADDGSLGPVVDDLQST